MPECPRCQNLEEILRRERKEIVRLKALNARISERAKGRKRLIDAGAASQLEADKAARRVLNNALTTLLDTPQLSVEWLRKHWRKVADRALKSLDRFEKPETTYHGRKRSEHAMPRHGKQSS